MAAVPRLDPRNLNWSPAAKSLDRALRRLQASLPIQYAVCNLFPARLCDQEMGEPWEDFEFGAPGRFSLKPVLGPRHIGRNRAVLFTDQNQKRLSSALRAYRCAYPGRGLMEDASRRRHDQFVVRNSLKLGRSRVGEAGDEGFSRQQEGAVPSVPSCQNRQRGDERNRPGDNAGNRSRRQSDAGGAEAARKQRLHKQTTERMPPGGELLEMRPALILRRGGCSLLSANARSLRRTALLAS